MKLSLFTLFILLLQTTVTAQTFKSAIFKECYDSQDPVNCTQEKLEIEISNLVTYDITKDIIQNIKEEYFSISVIFVTDKNGKITPEDTEIRCDNLLFKKAITDYINTLPQLYPKNNEDLEKRTLHTIYQTYKFDYVIKKYYPASKQRLDAEKIFPSYFMHDRPVLYPGCEFKKKEKENNSCTTKKIMKFITKNLIIPDLGNDSKVVNIITAITIEKDGTTTIKKIYGPEDILNKEMERVIKSFPIFTPAKMKGFPIASSYTFPVKITYHK